MTGPRTCIRYIGYFVPLELDSSTMAVIKGGSVDLRWHSTTDYLRLTGGMLIQ